MAAAASRPPSARRATFPFDYRDTFLFDSRAAFRPLRPPHRLPPPPTAAPTSPAPVPLSLAEKDLGAESSPAPAPSPRGSTLPPPVAQGAPRGAGSPSVEEAATSVEHQASSLPLQAAIGRNQATLKMPASRSSTAGAPPLQYPPAATVVSGGDQDAFRANASSIKMHGNDEGKGSGGQVREVAPKSCNKMESKGLENIRETASEDNEQKGGADLGNTGISSSHGGTLNYAQLKDDQTIKIMIHDAVQNAITGALESPSRSSGLKGFINESVNRAVNDSLLSSQPSSSDMSRADHMKLVRDALSEHQTFSRVLYVLALGTPVTLLITRAVRGQTLYTDKNMIRNTGLEMGFSFLIVSVCHLYIILFHFVRMDGPRVSIWMMRLIILFLCLLVSAWMLIYTFYMPQILFPAKFWWITGVFLAWNWVSSGILGCTGLLREDRMIDVE